LGGDKYVIFAATPSRLYYFVGRAEHEEKPLLQQVFNRYLNIPEKDTYIDSESNLKYSRLKFWSENLTVPNSFAWTTEKEIICGQFESGVDDSMSTLKKKTRTIKYPKPLYEDYSVSQKYPIAIALTEFHILLAYTDTIKGVCLLNEDVVYEDNYNEAFGKLINMVKDASTGEIWAITENAVFRFKVTKEERNVWQIFCENQQFDLAKKYSRGNEAFHNQVLIKEADMLFNRKEYMLSAQRYAETQSSFEEICLKFIQVEQQDSLKIFLRRKLDTLKPQDKTQITMIVIWVVELYLCKLEEKRLAGLEQSAAYSDVQKEFETFLALSEVSDCIKKNKSTIYELMSSHGDKSNLIKLTIVNKDFEQVSVVSPCCFYSFSLKKNDLTRPLNHLIKTVACTKSNFTIEERQARHCFFVMKLGFTFSVPPKILEFEQHIILTMLLKCHCDHLNMVVGLQCPKDELLAQYSSRKLLTLKRYHQSLFLHPGTNKRLF
jgi:hypothetical protein